MRAIVARDLIKSYASGKERIQALNSVSLDVEAGELFGLIGPDGAGKTSLIRILTTLILADRGSASIQGYDVVKDFKQIRTRIGYMPGTFSLYQDLTVEENLEFFATVFETTIAGNYDLVKDIYSQIEPFKNRRAGRLSGGMKQKLALCCALIHKPSVLILDEPTTGVDAVSRKEFWDMLHRLKVQGITILVSTPYMDEAALCDRVALIQAGTLLSIDTPDGIIRNFKKPLIAARASDMYRLLMDLKAYHQAENCYPFGEFHHVVLSYGADPERLRTYLFKKSHHDLEFKGVQPDIEDCFINLMGAVSPPDPELKP
ncbi:MAG TPA: ABC transporter ATP-binding protein [Sphingobacteriaceae bacterium]